MPTFGGISLLEFVSVPCSGTAFELDAPAREDAVAVTDGWSVEVSDGLKLVVARGGQDIGYEDAFRSGLLHAQQGLDLLSIQGKGDLSIRRFDDDHLAWWIRPEGLAIRVVSIAPVNIDVPPVTLTVTNASGRPVPSPPPTILSWHESFRYFRLSQTADDLFDAYRNAYLALESVLSSITPQKLSRAGKVAEREGAWFKRALSEANRILSLSTFTPAGTVDPIQHLFDELYVGMRSAMSHAKSGRRVLLPRNEAERQDVTESLGRLTQLYLKLAELHLGARRSGGAMFAVAFRMMTEPSFASMTVLASDDESPFNPADTVINPGGGSTAELTDPSPVDTTTPFLTTRLTSADARDLAELPFIRRVAAVSADGTPVMATALEAQLVLGTATRFEALLGARGANVRQPRSRYSF